MHFVYLKGRRIINQGCDLAPWPATNRPRELPFWGRPAVRDGKIPAHFIRPRKRNRAEKPCLAAWAKTSTNKMLTLNVGNFVTMPRMRLSR